ncbi:type II secretion system F family protein [Sphingosinicella terrae]|uniref:type II secretion system F family protein n=1 Tax=Sphingosinicella terrae TaxID=2172047 RepID=UPI000E0E00BB|nr:type II secretion system F family protein [Sphingosinicella terrae]
MTGYRCLVVTPEGRSDWRRIEASSEQSALVRLAADGHEVIDIRRGDPTLVERLNQPVRLRRTLSLPDQSLILTQLATLVQSGLPVDRSLDLLRDQMARPAQRELLAEALSRVRAGDGLAAALEARGAFPAFVTGVIRAAEQAGRLGHALQSVAERMALAAATRRQLATALTYPAAVLAATLFALGLVLTLVVPQFEPLFAGSEARLPALTRAVLALSRLTIDHGLELLLALVLLLATPVLLLRSGRLQPWIQRHRRLVPGLGLRDQYLAGQFCGLLGTLLDNGVAVVRALQLARETIGSDRWRRHLAAVEQRVREGERLSSALGRDELVPATAVRLMEVGERTGRLAETSIQASAVLGAAARARIERAVALANPIAIVGLGGLVALLVAGVMLGIFSLGDFAG